MTGSSEAEQQACEVPLVEQLRGIPKDYRTCRAIQWSDDGRETGHQIIPVGFMMHRAADMIEALKSATPANARAVAETCAEIAERKEGADDHICVQGNVRYRRFNDMLARRATEIRAYAATLPEAPLPASAEIQQTLLDVTNALSDSINNQHPYTRIVKQARALIRELAEAPQPATERSEPVAWFRLENGLRVYYETEAWPDLTPLYTAPLSETPAGGTAKVPEGWKLMPMEPTKEMCLAANRAFGSDGYSYFASQVSHFVTGYKAAFRVAPSPDGNEEPK